MITLSSPDKNQTDQPTSASMTANKRRIRLSVLPILAVALSACQSIPPVQTTPTVAHPNIPLGAGKNYEVYGDNQVPSSFASIRWQTFYTDPKLRNLIALGLENNKDIKQTLLAIRRAQAQYRISDNRDLPTFNGNGEYSRSASQRDKNPSDGYSVNLGMANYELDFWGKISSLKEQALQNYLATTAANDTAQVALIANIAKSYVNLSYQLKQLELANRTFESRQESLRITMARLNAGIDSKAPSLQAAASVETAHIAALNAETNVLKAKNALKYLVGAPITDDMLPAPAITSIVADDVISAGLPSELLRYRPDVLQAEYRLKAAGANIDVARASFYPSISLTGRLGYTSSDLSNLFDSNALGWSFGPSISVPIFDAGQLDSNYEVAQIERDQALAEYEQTIETAFREVNDVLAEQSTLDAKTRSQYRLQQHYNEIFNISRARYQAQVDDYLSVLDAERSLFSTQQTILNLEQERLNNQINLYQVLGGGANLVEPISIPTPQNTNLINLLVPQTNEEKAAEAVKAASSPAILTDNQADIIESQQPVDVVKATLIEPIDLTGDNNANALISEIETTTTLPAKPKTTEVNKDIVDNDGTVYEAIIIDETMINQSNSTNDVDNTTAND